MKRNSIFLSIFLLLTSLAHAQTLKKEFPSEQQIDVIETWVILFRLIQFLLMRAVVK